MLLLTKASISGGGSGGGGDVNGTVVFEAGLSGKKMPYLCVRIVNLCMSDRKLYVEASLAIASLQSCRLTRAPCLHLLVRRPCTCLHHICDEKFGVIKLLLLQKRGMVPVEIQRWIRAHFATIN